MHANPAKININGVWVAGAVFVGVGELGYHTSELPAIKMIIRLTPPESAFFGVVILVGKGVNPSSHCLWD